LLCRSAPLLTSRAPRRQFFAEVGEHRAGPSSRIGRSSRSRHHDRASGDRKSTGKVSGLSAVQIGFPAAVVLTNPRLISWPDPEN
jgi:hypothetical protein